MTYGNYPDLKGVKKILVIKMRHHGDVLLTTPLFSVLRKAFPEAVIDVFIYKETLPMLEGHPALSSFFLYDRAWKKCSLFKKIKEEAKLFYQIYRNKYDMVFNLTEGDRGALASFFSRSPVRVGMDPEGNGFLGKKKIYTHVVKNCKLPRHAVERNLDALRCIGIFPQEEERELLMHIPKEAEESVKLKIGGFDPFILVHPVSRWRFKCWPPEQVGSLLKQLHSQGKKIVLTSGPDKEEREMIEEILKIAGPLPLCNLAGKISLKELGALIKKAEKIICVDTVALHIASAFKTPLIVLFGPTSEKNWGPWNHPHSQVVTQSLPCRPCLMDGCGGSKYSDCLHTLPVQKVLQALQNV